jgi:hypothetical protein
LGQRKIHHGGTEITEKGRMARFARQTLILRGSVVNLYYDNPGVTISTAPPS